MYVPQQVRDLLNGAHMGGLLPEDRFRIGGAPVYRFDDEESPSHRYHAMAHDRALDALRAYEPDQLYQRLTESGTELSREDFDQFIAVLQSGDDLGGVSRAELDLIGAMAQQAPRDGSPFGGALGPVGDALHSAGEWATENIVEPTGSAVTGAATDALKGAQHGAEEARDEIASGADSVEHFFDESVPEFFEEDLPNLVGGGGGEDGDAADAERERQEAHEQAVRTGVERLREMYGYGETAMARSNRSRIDRMIRDQKEALAGMQADQAMDAYADAQVGQRAAFARSGNVGGGAQQAQSRRNTGNLVQSFQGIQGNARQYGTQIQSQLDQDLLQQENNILQSEVAPELYFQPQRLARNMRSAQGNAPQLALQSMFNSGANMVMVDAQSRGMGRRGVFGGGG